MSGMLKGKVALVSGCGAGIGEATAHMIAVATEYGLFGIRANAVTPRPTDTTPLRTYLESRPGGVDGHTADLDLARLSQPREMANTVMWLASDLSSNITGICVRSNIRAASRRS